MPFGKKKEREGEAEGPAEAAGEPGLTPPETGDAAAPDGNGADLEGAAPAGEAAEGPTAEAPEAAATPPAGDAAAGGADALGGGDLLSMFQSTQVESDDRAALLELAGEVEIDDLLEDLQTVAAALGIKPAA
jgi:hypothetical protein